MQAALIRQYGLSDKLDIAAYKKLSAKEKLQYVCDLTDKAMEYNRFWSKGDTYFAGDWLNDTQKQKEALRMLELEMELSHGQIDLNKLSNTNQTNKLMVIQEIFGADPTGELDQGTIDRYIDRMPSDKAPNYKLTSSDLKRLQEKNEEAKNSDSLKLLGELAIRLGASVVGADLIFDFADLADDIRNWQWTLGHLAMTGADTVSFVLPGDDLVKYADEITGFLKASGKQDDVADLVKAGKKTEDVVDGIKSGTGVISEIDRIKIKNWDYTPSDELYIKYKKVFDNPQYYNQTTGEIKWPKNDGFAETPIDEVLEAGTKIDRYGSDYGSFVSPEGVPYEMRAVAPGTDMKPYSVFEVIKPITVKSGKIAPWFDEPGGGTQYLLPSTVDELLEAGVIRRLK